MSPTPKKNPTHLSGLHLGTQSVTADDAESGLNSILAGANQVAVTGVTNDADDFVVMPSLADVPIGHCIYIACNAGSNFELRTPASSGEKINNIDSDGTQEYLCTDTDTIRIRKVSDTDGWTAESITLQGTVRIVTQSVTADDAESGLNSILAESNQVAVAGVTNDADDFVVMPALADVPIGHCIYIACNAGANFELRTPASSSEKINNVDADGTQEYLCTDTDTIRIWKVSDTDGWAAQSITLLGAVRTAVVPD